VSPSAGMDTVERKSNSVLFRESNPESSAIQLVARRSIDDIKKLNLFKVLSFVCCVLFERGVLFCAMCVTCVLCLIVVPLPLGNAPFAV
jgi:hypothetical protein